MAEPTGQKRLPKDPTPRFKAEDQDGLRLAEHFVPSDHLARRVLRVVEALDVSELEKRYSALGQHAYRPRWLLGVWVYASLKGLHHTTQVERALETDGAFRLLSGGHAISRPVLNRFRQRGGEYFAAALQRTVTWAMEQELVDAKAVAVDSMRLRAHAGRKAVRSLKHSQRRLQELADSEPTLNAEAREAQVQKHRPAVETCIERKVKTFLTTNPLAALIQFPGGGYHPGHRLTVTSCGAQARIALGVLVNAAPNDTGLLGPALRQARRALTDAGLPKDTRLQVAADAGYWSEVDLAFAESAQAWLDVLVPEIPERGPLAGGKGFLPRSRFTLNALDDVRCPSGAAMKRHGFSSRDRAHAYKGQDCPQCPLRSQCTTGERRTLTVNWTFEALRRRMRERMGSDEAKARYAQRAPTIEPVFSSLESSMNYRVASSRSTLTIQAEVLLKLLAYNISRLLAGTKLFCVLILFDPADPLLAQNLKPAEF